MQSPSNVKCRQQLLRNAYKKNLIEMFSSVFRRRKGVEADEETLGCPSESSSESSTLIDFVVYDSESTTPSVEGPIYSADFLDSSNRARNSSSSRTVAQIATSTNSWANSQTSLLDEDDCTWVMPRARIRGSTSNARKERKVLQKTSKLQTDLLEPEERSWV